MNLQPLKQWVCDECGEIIEDVKHGYVEWLNDENLKAKGFRIVHHPIHSPRKPDRNCYKYMEDYHHANLDLETFVGDVGFVQMLYFMDVGPHHNREFSGPGVCDIREWVELFRRIHLPYYEEARLYWAKAEDDGYFNEMNEVKIYLPETLQDIINNYEE